ncbi:hypothetical protein Tco_0093530 [Tanacetum coccineum]
MGLTLGQSGHEYAINAASERNFYAKDTDEMLRIDRTYQLTHKHWDTSATRDETSRNISSTTTESPEVVRQLEMMNKNFVEMMRQIQTVKSVDTKCETCGGPHSFTECPAVGGYTQEAVYATTVGPSNELTSYMKSNEATLRAMQTQMTNMKTELRNEFKSTIDARTNKIENQNNQIMNILTNMQNQTPRSQESLPSNTIANPKGDVKAITTRSGVAYDGPSILPTPSPLPKEVKRETKATKDKDVACEEYAQEVLGFRSSFNFLKWQSHSVADPTTFFSPLFTVLLKDDISLEEIETFLRTPEELSNLDDDYYDTEGDILYLEKLLNEDPSPTLPLMKNDDLKQVDVTLTKPLIEEPPELELKDLPSYLEYAFFKRTE